MKLSKKNALTEWEGLLSCVWTDILRLFIHKRGDVCIALLQQLMADGSFKKSVDYLFFRFCLGKSESHELYELLACDLTDSSLVNESCVDIVGFK